MRSGLYLIHLYIPRLSSIHSRQSYMLAEEWPHTCSPACPLSLGAWDCFFTLGLMGPLMLLLPTSPPAGGPALGKGQHALGLARRSSFAAPSSPPTFPTVDIGCRPPAALWLAPELSQGGNQCFLQPVVSSLRKPNRATA